MKKLFIAILLIAATATATASDGELNYEKIYPIHDEIVSDMKDLYILAGYALPSTAGPYSGSELKMALERIDRDSLRGGVRELYDRIERKLTEDAEAAAFTFSFSVSPEIYVHTNTSKDFQTWDNWMEEWADNKSTLSIVGEQHIGRNFYGFFDFSIGATKTKSSKTPGEAVAFGDRIIETNIPIAIMSNLDFNFPYRAFVAAGGKNWSLQVGRERYSWGPGHTGNFILGDHIKYHNSARVTAFSKNFKYTFLVLSFIHPQNYYFADIEENPSSLHPNGSTDGQSSYLNGISAFIAHRLEWRLFQNKVGIALTEGVMYMSKDNRIDLIALSPAHLFHNSYTRSLTNSILSLEVDYTPISGLNLYTEIVMDEMVLPGEPKPGKDTKLAEPSAMGYMLGATYTMEAWNGILSFNIEGAYTDPYLYLRDGDAQVNGTSKREQHEGDWGINFVVPTREMINTGGKQYFDEQFLGYRWGGDAIVAQLSASYRRPDSFFAGASLFYMAHGTHDKWTVWTRVNGDYNNVTTPTTEHQTENNYPGNNAEERDSVRHVIDVGLNGGVYLPYGFSIYTDIHFMTVVHPGNVKANGAVFDMQWSLGIAWSI